MTENEKMSYTHIVYRFSKTDVSGQLRRDDAMPCVLAGEVVKGLSLVFLGQSLTQPEKPYGRMVKTSTVKEIEERADGILFCTTRSGSVWVVEPIK